ncbi:acyltransferase [Frankia sp. CNm7]|uniref:Acyltransferase n=1 Tax=Frankia nepalensis TaxID=1836974 RepID=A0A937UQC4_9ACTN|nr:acyltransferase family protein [Frankia nepalensis]MBL7495608.1 acyltransferase [Frankia nepalensis]MBL7508854.1 acyltransferase [Frankia nepalensis]MBL7524223.1 acyltransferase [Frankia nepalensis]MBL7630077.1 acyltransferase [Frankia nepalensis]
MSNTIVLPTQRVGEPGDSRAVPTGRPVPRRFRPDIQGLRAIAIVTVAFYHAEVPFLTGGYIGVDVFFVISGFLITRQLHAEAVATGRVSLARFYAARFRRLLPPAALVVACSVAVAHYVLPYQQMKSLMTDVGYAAFYGVNYHFAYEGVQYQNASDPPSPVQHFWSLAVEEQFYAVWPVLILLCCLLGRRRPRYRLVVTAIAAITVATLAYSVAISADQAPLAYFSLQTRAWELGAGALVALTADRWARLPARLCRILAWSGLGAILAAAVLYDEHTVYPGVAAVVPVAGAALLIGAGVLRHGRTPETFLLERPSMQYAGKVSYAWYLWHWPMLILLPAWVGRPLGVWEQVEIVCLAFWFAVLTYFLEDAARRASWSTFGWIRAGAALSAFVALCSVAGTLTLPSLETSGVARSALALNTPDVTAVQAALTRSIQIERLPRNLTPALADAPTDMPPGMGSCGFADLHQTEIRLCDAGDLTAERVAVVLGDSHAHQWMTALDQEAKRTGWKLVEITKGACPIADVQFFQNDLKREYRECDVFRRWAAAEVARLQPDLVIASQSNIAPWDNITDEEWARRSVAALVTLAGSTASVAYIGDTPTFLADPITCLQRNLDEAQRCLVPRTEAFGRFPDRYFVIADAMRRAGIGYVDTLPFFCTPRLCPAAVDNMTVYRDQGHITDTYATWLAPMLQPIFRGVPQ